MAAKCEKAHCEYCGELDSYCSCDMVEFLCSRCGGQVNGQIMTVDDVVVPKIIVSPCPTCVMLEKPKALLLLN
jgi:hypothetical protein